MKKIIPIVTVGIIAVIYFIWFEGMESDDQGFLDIVDYNIIQIENSPIFLSVTVSDNIPNIQDAQNYGYGWLSYDSEKLSGYITNTHADSKWHSESITINDTRQFCFDNIQNVISNVTINKNKIKVVIEKNDSTNFDKVISYEIIEDSNCHLGFAGKIIDTKIIN